jgi:hypothetical protein
MRLVAAATAAAALALAAPAAAQETQLSGETAEGAPVKLTVAEFGNATAFQIGKQQIDCKRGGTLTTRKTTYTDFDTSDPGAFQGKFQDTSGSGGFKFKATTTVVGNVDAGAASWSGTYTSKTKVLKHGDKIDTCTIDTTWQAS